MGETRGEGVREGWLASGQEGEGEGREGGRRGRRGGETQKGRERGSEAEDKEGGRGLREGEREGGRRETSSCRSFFAPASISAFTASVCPYIAEYIRALHPSCPPQEEGEGT